MPWKQQNINWVISQPGGSVHVDDTTSVSRIFDSRLSYSKGALVLHTLRWIIGDEAFFQAINGMLNHAQHAYGFVRTTDLIAFFEQASGWDLTYYFDQWYYGQGNDTLLVLDNTYNGQSFAVDPGFIPDNIVFDPDLWLISKNNQVIIGVEEIGMENLTKVFPNPAADIIYIESPVPVDAITFIGADGEMTEAKSFHQSHGQLYLIGVDHLEPGLWVVRVQAGDQALYKKLMIAR